jgi:hypothetical protein
MIKFLTSCLLILMVSPLFSQIFYYPFNNGNTDNQINNGFGTIITQQTSPTSDALGNSNSALSFSGSAPQIWVNSGDLIDFGLTTSFSFVTDFYSNSAAEQDLFRDLLANGNGWQIGFYDNSGYVTFEAGEGSSSISVRTEDIYNDGEWHQLALIVNKADLTIQIYVDGVPSDLVAQVCGEELTGSIVSIEGCNFNANEDNTSLTTLGEDLLGGMDEISLYSSVLSTDDIEMGFASSFIGQAELDSPSNNAEGLNPEAVLLEWDDFGSALSYEIEYDTNTNFPAAVQLSSATNSVAAVFLNVDTEYFWRVRAITDLGESLYSDVWSFNTQELLTGVPSLTSPSNNIENINPQGIQLNWSNLNDALTYTVQYDISLDFSTSVEVPASSSDYDLPTLDEGTTYYWRVQGINDVSISEYSDTWSFSTASALISAPVLASPASGATDVPFVNLPLTWNSLNGAEDYTLEYSESNSFLSPDVVNVDGLSSTLEALTGSTTYYWRVKAENSIGSSPYSDVWSFTTEVNSSVEELDIKVLVNIYPNPVSDFLSLKCSSSPQNIMVLDMQGAEVAEIEKVQMEDKLTIIKTTKLSSGCYILRVEFEKYTQNVRFTKD